MIIFDERLLFHLIALVWLFGFNVYVVLIRFIFKAYSECLKSELVWISDNWVAFGLHSVRVSEIGMPICLKNVRWKLA